MSVATGLQTAGDFFRSDRRRIQLLMTIVRVGAIGILFLLLNSIRQILVDGVLSTSNLITVFEFIFLFFFSLMVGIISLLISFPIAAMALGLVPFFILRRRLLYAFGSLIIIGGISFLFYNLLSIEPTFLNEILLIFRSFLDNFLFNGLDVETQGIDTNQFLGTSDDPFSPLAYLFLYSTRMIWETPFLHGIIYLALIFATLTGINFIIRGDVSQAAWTFGLAQVVIGLAYLNELVLPLSLDGSTIGSLFSSTLFQIGLISYLYLEYSLQTGYLNQIAQPSLERQKRVGAQLAKLSQFRLGITKLGTEEEQASRKIKKTEEDTEEGGEKKSTALSVGGSGSRTARKYGAEALVFLLDSTKDSLFGSKEGEKEKMTGRLQRYHDGLLRHDRRLDEKLGGSVGKAFSPLRTSFYIIVSMLFRLSLLLLFSWLVLNADVFFEYIQFPQTLTNSIEFEQPESILLVLIPLIFLILGVSLFIVKLQSWLITAEEFIIQESEIQKLMKRGKAVTSRKEMEEQQAKLAEEQAKKDAKEAAKAGAPAGKRRRRKKATKK